MSTTINSRLQPDYQSWLERYNPETEPQGLDLWHERWFRLESYQLVCYTRPDNNIKIDCVDLQEWTIAELFNKFIRRERCLMLCSQNKLKKFYLWSEDEQIINNWLKCLSRVCQLLSPIYQQSPTNDNSDSSSDSEDVESSSDESANENGIMIELDKKPIPKKKKNNSWGSLREPGYWLYEFLSNKENFKIQDDEIEVKDDEILLAAKNDNWNKVKSLIKKGSISIRNDVLFEAVKKNNMEMVRYLIEEEKIRIMHDYILLKAIKRNNLEMVKYLVEKGAYVISDIHISLIIKGMNNNEMIEYLDKNKNRIVKKDPHQRYL